MPFLLCLFSAALLDVSFPRLEWSFLAWVALAPLLCALDGQKPWRAFRRAYLCGFLFFAATLGWIVYVTPIGAVLLAAFLALYFALFGVMFVYFQRYGRPLTRILVLSATWTALEFVRAHFLSGFGWVTLGHSQYKNLWLIQIADTIGVYGVSFVVVMVNLLVFETWRKRAFLPQASVAVLIVVSGVLLYGFNVVHRPGDHRSVSVGLVQPNIPLAVDWDENLRPWIVDRTIQLTDRFKDRKLDLIVWPETSLPGTITDSPYLTQKIQRTAQEFHSALLIGSVAEDRKSTADHFYNSAFLIDANGQMSGRYDKIHLVPFGEYLPLRPLLGWINKFVPLDDFTFGTTYKIFSVTLDQKKFAVLICFEDALGDLGRRFAREGAEFFVNMTNDAWFRQTRAPFLHLQAAVLTCVENHRALARAANTGVSALVDPWGRITATLDNGGQKLFVAGTAWGTLPLNDQQTFYTKYGDIFTYLCFLCILLAAIKGIRMG